MSPRTLPRRIHPLTGRALVPVGYRRDGRPIWPIAGGSEPPAGGQPPAGGGQPPPAPPAPPAPPSVPEKPDGVSDAEWAALGDPGKAALVRERQRATAAEQRLAQVKDYDALKDKAAKYDKALEDAKSEQERAVDAARREGGDAVRAELNRERVLDKIEVAAAGKFRDVEDARLRLGQRADEFIVNGVIDRKAIDVAVDEVLQAAPHLKADTSPRGPRPDPSQGPRGGDRPLGEQGRAEAQRRWSKQQ